MGLGWGPEGKVRRRVLRNVGRALARREGRSGRQLDIAGRVYTVAAANGQEGSGTKY